jgi:hypothetical protein
MMKKIGKGDGGVVGPVVDLGKDKKEADKPKPVVTTPDKPKTSK